MNREIKFRAWDGNSKIMHYGFQFIRSGVKDNDWIIFTSDKHPLTNIPHPFNDPYFQKQFIIMQFTGMKDRTGKEIYEYDVLFNRDGQYVVHYSVKWGRWLLVALNGYKDWVLASEPLNGDVDAFGLNGDEAQQSEIIGLLSFKS